MDEIEERLKNTADNCIKSYEAWVSKKQDAPLRENLQEAVHELRKVAARLEIEIAVSERKETNQKPLPIPPHRSSQKGPKGSRGKPNGKDNAQQDDNELPSFISRGEKGGNNKPKGRGRTKKPETESGNSDD